MKEMFDYYCAGNPTLTEYGIQTVVLIIFVLLVVFAFWRIYKQLSKLKEKKNDLDM